MLVLLQRASVSGSAHLMSTRSVSATSSKERVCGACSAGGPPPTAGCGLGGLGFGVVCGSFKPHIGGSSSWGEDSSTVGKTVSPIQVSRNTRVVLVVKRFWGARGVDLYRRVAWRGYARVTTLELDVGGSVPSPQVLECLITFQHSSGRSACIGESAR